MCFSKSWTVDGLVFARFKIFIHISAQLLFFFFFTAVKLSEADLVKAANMGIDLIEKLQRYESNIAASPVRVQNGSVSHGLLLENYPTSYR